MDWLVSGAATASVVSSKGGLCLHCTVDSTLVTVIAAVSGMLPDESVPLSTLH
jgi:hypothetical protein